MGVALDHAERPPAAQRLNGEHVLRLARRDGGCGVARVVCSVMPFFVIPAFFIA